MFVLANIVDAVGFIAHMLISAYILVIIAACVASWFNVAWHPAVRALRRLTDPVLYWTGRKLRFAHSINGIDLTPVIVVIGLELIDLVVVRSVRQLAATL